MPAANSSGKEARGARGIFGLIINNPGSAIYGTIAVGAYSLPRACVERPMARMLRPW